MRAAFEMRERVGVLNDGLLPEHGLFLELRSAVATGEVLVKPGSEELVTGRASGRGRAARRRAQTGQILLAGSTHPLVRDVVGAEEVPPDEAGGVAGAFRLVELLPDIYGRACRLDSRSSAAADSSPLSRARSRARSRSRRSICSRLLGQAGVGKSRLVREFADGVEGVATLLQGRCLPYGEAITYWALSEALRDAGLPEPSSATSPFRRSGVIFERLAHERPLVVLLDDVHWAEAAFLDLLEALAESSRGSPILLVCVARPTSSTAVRAGEAAGGTPARFCSSR